jgi:HTH-type transcriptional regulator, cell division transcriptional repressor
MVQNNKQERSITLEALRKKAKYSQRSLAAKLGTTHDVIVHWEKGRNIPRFDNAIALACVLGVSLKTLAESMGFDVSLLPDECENN